MSQPNSEPEPIYHMVKCEFCWVQLRSDQAFQSRGFYFCDEKCDAKHKVMRPDL
jgi:hypothetical protein